LPLYPTPAPFATEASAATTSTSAPWASTFATEAEQRAPTSPAALHAPASRNIRGMESFACPGHPQAPPCLLKCRRGHHRHPALRRCRHHLAFGRGLQRTRGQEVATRRSFRLASLSSFRVPTVGGDGPTPHKSPNVGIWDPSLEGPEHCLAVMRGSRRRSHHSRCILRFGFNLFSCVSTTGVVMRRGRCG